MLRFSLRVARKEKIRHKYISGTALETKLEKQGLDGVDIWINVTKDSRKEEERMATRRRKRLRYHIWLFNVPNKIFYSVIFFIKPIQKHESHVHYVVLLQR